ncbi:MAG: MMPL family transporter [Deltaproteobacteria bacterium]|nr:MMPL family transporter [Deltaproteobacteria bacterium]
MSKLWQKTVHLIIRLLLDKRLSIAVVVVTLLGMVAAYFSARNLESEDDLLAFLPEGDSDVQAFKEINEKFGSLQVALVGIKSDDVLSPDFLTRLDKLTKRLKDMGGLSHVLSLTNVVDYVVDETQGGVVTGPLVTAIPKNREEVKRLRKKIMSREAVKGNLISEDGKSAVVVYCFIAPGSKPKETAGRIEKEVKKEFPKEAKYWGGAPFISSYIYNTTKDDLAHLTHWAVLVIVLVIVLSFRDLIGAFLALMTTGMGILVTLAAMSAVGVKFNIVLGGMPIILFALGSAYGIHLLSRYYMLARHEDTLVALERALIGIGPTILAAGFTTAVSLLSFLMMNIEPLRTFGLFTALGILANLLFSLTFLPAVVRLMSIKRLRSNSEITLRRLTMKMCLAIRRRRRVVLALVGVVTLIGLSFSGTVDTTVEPTTFYSKGSPPDKASKFLKENFGGDQFLQVEVHGDMEDPFVLRQVQRLADSISLMPGVVSVMHIGYMIASLNDAMADEKRVPVTKAQIRSLYPFIMGDESVARFITPKKDRTLVQVKIDGSDMDRVEALLNKVETWLDSKAIKSYRVVSCKKSLKASRNLEDLVLLRIHACLHGNGIEVSRETLNRLKTELGKGYPKVPFDLVAGDLANFLESKDSAVELPKQASDKCNVKNVSFLVAGMGPGATQEEISSGLLKICGNLSDDPDFIGDLAFSLSGVIGDTWRREKAKMLAGKIIPLLAKDHAPSGIKKTRMTKSIKKEVTSSLLDLGLASFVVPVGPKSEADGKLEYRISGQPVMNRGLSRSARNNQIKSLLFAFLLVFPIMAWLFRSLVSGLLGIIPSMVTLSVVFGGMGILHVHLDIGTAMLASLVLGAGVDYAIHMLSAWRAVDNEKLEYAAARTADRTGPAIWTNALMVAAGFFILTLGEAKPLQNVGGLTSAAMLIAALATFIVLPALAKRRAYRPLDDKLQEETSSLMKEVMK